MRIAPLFLAAAALAAPLAAQPPAPGDRPRPDRAQFEQRMAAKRAQHADDLAIVLSLKPAQRPALDQWLAAMTPPHGPRGSHGARGEAPDTLPERLDRDQARLAEHQQRASAMIEATKRFYGSLDAQQRKVFDALDRLRHDDPFGPPRGPKPGGPGGPGDMPPPPPPPPPGA